MGIISRFRGRRQVPVPEKRSSSFWGGIPLAGWRSGGGVGVDTSSGVAVTPFTALSYNAVWGAVRVIAESVAALPLITYERTATGKKRAVDFPLYSLLHDLPNPELTAFEFWEATVAHMLTWGNSFAYIHWDGSGYPVALWPMRPDHVTLGRNDRYERYYTWHSDRFGPVMLMDYQVMHLRGLSPNGYVGYSPIRLFRESIGLGLSAEQYGASFFGNGAWPGGVLEHPNLLDDEAEKRLRKSWESMHRGLDNAHRVAILEEGMAYKQIGLPPEDAQFLQTRKFQVGEIARIYRVPPHMLADLENATFSNIEHQAIQFVMHTLRPWLVRIEMGIGRDLMLPADRARYEAEFLVDSLLRGDTESRYRAYNMGRQGGWLSANDIRVKENMDRVENGDVLLVPLNMVPLSEVSANEGVRRLGQERTVGELRAVDVYGDVPGYAVRSVLGRRRLEVRHEGVFEQAVGRILRREADDVGNQIERMLPYGVGEFGLWLDGFLP